MRGAAFEGELNAVSLQVGIDLRMNSNDDNQACTFKKHVRLTSAKVTGDLNMRGAVFNGELDANGLQVGIDLLMSAEEQVSRFKQVDLTNAKVGNVFSMRGTITDGDLIASSSQVGKDMVLRKANISGQIRMISASVGGNLDLRGATIASFDLT